MKKCILFLFFVCFYSQSYSQISICEDNDTVNIYKSSDFSEAVKNLTKLFKKEPHIYNPYDNGNSMSLLDVPSITTDIFSESYKSSIRAKWEMQDDVYTNYSLERNVRQNGDIEMIFKAQFSFFNLEEEQVNYIFQTQLYKESFDELGKETNKYGPRNSVYYEWVTPGLRRTINVKRMVPNKNTWRITWTDEALK